MVETMIYGRMETDRNQSPDTAILMKSLLVQYYIKRREEANHEVFRQNI